jgi:hypothetical protein
MSRVIDKLNRISHQTRQSNRAKNDAEYFVREVLQEQNAHHDRSTLCQRLKHWQQEAAASVDSRTARLSDGDVLTSLHSQRRNHRLMLRLLRHPGKEGSRADGGGGQLQIVLRCSTTIAMEASRAINQILPSADRNSAVKYALLRDLRAAPHGVGCRERLRIPRAASSEPRRGAFFLRYHAVALTPARCRCARLARGARSHDFANQPRKHG